jgi:uncharacterized LabA/DUF88 family protein
VEKILRIGIFYDGTYFTNAQKHFYKKDYGWLKFQPLHNHFQDYIRKRYKEFYEPQIVHSVWYQGLSASNSADENRLKNDRKRHLDLMHAGIEMKFQPMSQSLPQCEKGVDVAMAIDIFEIGIEGTIDVAVLITGDGDFVPLVRALMKKGIGTVCAYFEYKENGKESFANKRLKEVCSHALNINEFEDDENKKHLFNSLFLKYEKEQPPICIN